MKEIFQKLVLQLIQDIGDVSWRKSVLEIMRLKGTVRFSATYLDTKNEIHNVETNFGFWEAKLVHNLYDITQNEAPIHKNWNRAKLSLLPGGKMQIEYLWDQELEDEVDRYNNES